MIEIERRQIIQEALEKKFKGKTIVKSRVKLHYKPNLEKEYEEIVRRFYRMFLNSLMPVLKDLFQDDVLVKEIKGGFRTDDKRSNFIDYVRKALEAAKEDFHQKDERFNLLGKIDKLGQLTKKLSIKDWKRVVSKTLGIDLLDDYYSGDFYREQLKLWTEENARLIKTLPDEAVNDMQNLIEDMYIQGKSGREIVMEIQKRYNASRSKATFYAVDQLAKLNASITQQQQTEIGVTEYEWSSSGDERVRDRHRELDGTIQKWSEPPIVDAKTGRKAHPGQDYRCRCVALPVFNIHRLNTSIMK